MSSLLERLPKTPKKMFEHFFKDIDGGKETIPPHVLELVEAVHYSAISTMFMLFEIMETYQWEEHRDSIMKEIDEYYNTDDFISF